MRKPRHDSSIFKKRREQIKEHLKEGDALVCAAHPHFVRNDDVHYPFRQDSNLFYLTGFEEPESVLVFRPGKTPESVLFVAPKDEKMEIWEGFRFGPEGAKNEYGMDAAFTIDQLDKELPELLNETDNLYYTRAINKGFDEVIDRTIEKLAHRRARANAGNLSIIDPRRFLGEMRLRKSEFEIDQLRKAAEISSKAHIEVMKACKPGLNERALYATFLKSIMEQGCDREAYGGIFAGGNNATTLHYTFNDAPLIDGEMFLIDAGGEYNYYAADITRTYPINGKFTEPQRRLYEKMLQLQKEIVAGVKPNATREELQKQAIDGATEIMIEEKLLKGDKSQLIEDKAYLKYYMHGIGHWLGADVHDTGMTQLRGEPRPLEPGFYLTIEPGIYISADDKDAPEELRGIGIRIEDDILVTKAGNEVFTSACPKEVDELEAIIGKG